MYVIVLTVQRNKFCCHSMTFYNIRLKGSIKRVLYQLAQWEIQLTLSGQSNTTNDTLCQMVEWLGIGRVSLDTVHLEQLFAVLKQPQHDFTAIV